MKLGLIEIENAYLGNLLLDSSNAFIGTTPLIDSSSGPTPVDPTDYFYVELDPNYTNTSNKILIKASTANDSSIEYSKDKNTWSNTYQYQESTNTITVTDTIKNMKGAYGKERCLAIRGTSAFPSGQLATASTGETSTINIEGSFKYLCFIMNNKLSTYTNGISFTVNGTTINVTAAHIASYLSGNAKAITCNGSSSSGTNTNVNVDKLNITATTYDSYYYLNATSKIYFRATGYNDNIDYLCNPLLENQENYFKIGGNVQTLFDYTTMDRTRSNYMYRMFYRFTKLTDASNFILGYSTVGMYAGLIDGSYSNEKNSHYGGMFTNCTNLRVAPALPATIFESGLPAAGAGLYYGNYYSMFNGCTSLTSAPELPATTLVKTNYTYMFSNCTSLNYVKCLATDISAQFCTQGWLSNVSSTGTFIKNPNMSSWTTGNSGIPSGWTVQDAQ